MSYLPCKNPSCHSYGRPHPNCRCYDGLAHGGNVSHFCAEDRAHKAGCEYFNDGGVAGDDLGFEPDNKSPHDDLGFEPDTKPNSPSDDLGFVPDKKRSDDDLGFEPDSASETAEDKYSSPLEKVKATAEGLGHGWAGPLATLAETKLLGVDPKDIQGRADANPELHGLGEIAGLGAGLLSGTGEIGLIPKAAGAIANATKLGAIGSAAIKGAIAAGAFSASDEASKYLLGQSGDPSQAVSSALIHIAGSTLIGGSSGALFNMWGPAIRTLAKDKIAQKAQTLLQDLGASSAPVTDALSFLYGVHAGYKAEGSVRERMWEGEKAAVSADLNIRLATKLGFPFIKKLNEKAAAAIAGALAKNAPDAAPAAVAFAKAIVEGNKKLDGALGSVFDYSVSKVVPAVSDEMLQELESNVKDGNVQNQIQNQFQKGSSDANPPLGFAEGGQVGMPQGQEQDHFSTAYPEASTSLNTAKGRVYQYLNSIRPLPNQQRAPYDKPIQNKDQERSYKKALTLAANPLEVLNHVQEGTLTAETMGHFSKLWPEIHSQISKKMTERIMKDQLGNKSIPYAKRQAMSLFLGANLDSSLSPAAIQAAQSVFIQKQMQQQTPPPGKNKKGTSSLSKVSQGFQTSDQSRQLRQQKV